MKKVRKFFLALTAAFILVLAASGCGPDDLLTPTDKVRMICPLMGVGKTETSLGVGWSSDLGVMAFHHNKVFLLTGDTFGTGIYSPNSLAWTTDTHAADCLDLNWSVTRDGSPQYFFPHIGRGSISTVPAGAISVNGNLYVFMMDVTYWSSGSTDSTNARVALIKSSNDGQSFGDSPIWTSALDNHFVNIAPVVAAHPTIPHHQAVYMFGSGLYRESDIYLAACDTADIEDRSKYIYFKGFVGDQAQWGIEADAQPIVTGVKTGELSVQWSCYLQRWLLSAFDYTSGNLYFRSATSLSGPWSAPKLVFEGSKVYHWYQPGWFGPYGGYLLHELDRGGGRYVYFTLSLWVPYNIFLMEADLKQIFK